MGQQPALAFPHPGEGGCGAAQRHRVLPGKASPPRPHTACHELTMFSRRLWRYPVLLREPNVPLLAGLGTGIPAPGLGGSKKSSGCPRGLSHSCLLPLSQCRCPLQLGELQGQRSTACKNRTGDRSSLWTVPTPPPNPQLGQTELERCLVLRLRLLYGLQVLAELLLHFHF